jgi:tripartite ATP-independent transporter DctM subunit
MELQRDGAQPGGKALRIVDGVTEAIITAALIGEVGVVFLNVLSRFFLGTSLLWTEEMSRLALSVLAFVGGALAYRRGYHTSVAILLNAMPAALRRASLATADFLVLGIVSIVFVQSLTLIEIEWTRETAILQMPASVFMIPLSASMPLFAIYALVRLSQADKPALIAAAAAFAAIAATAFLLRASGTFDPDAIVYVALAILFGSVFIGLPIAFALLASSFAFFWLTGSPPLLAIPQRMVGDTGNFILLAIPFFIFAGLIMERGELSLRLVQFGHALVGHVRGGLHQVAVVSMYLVSGLSGSDAADVAAVGTVMRNMPERDEYSKEEGAAVLAASAVMGSTVPPSIAMLLLGSITQITIAGLFIGGLIPAIVMAICLMILIYVKARRADIPKVPRAPAREMVAAGLGAILPMLMPVILFGGILTGAATPTEVASFAVVYGLVVAMFVYRVVNLRGLVRAAIDSALLTGMILFILGAATTFSWMLTIAMLPQRLVDLLQSFGGDSGTIFLLGSIALLIVTGALLEGLPALNILAPMLVPLAPKFGLSELHYGMVLLISMGVGVFSPPMGVGFYIACGVMRTPIEPAAKAMIPYLIVLVIGLLIVAFVPWFTLFLPHAFGFRG